MKTYRDYTELSQKIHAPEELKTRVLQASLQGGRRRERTAAGRYSRGWSVAQKAAAAAILLAVCLPVTAYAAVKGLGLKEKLAQWGMQDIQAVEDLSVSASEISGGATGTDQASVDQEKLGVYSDRFAEYSFVEAVLDSKTVYIAAKITPLDNNNLLIPDIAFSDDVFTVDGVTVGTAEEYAASQGKKIVYTGIRFNNEENPINGAGYDYQLLGDGSIYYYFSGDNTFDSKEVTLQCTSISYTEDMNFDEFARGEFEITLTDKSTTSAGPVYTVFDPKVYAETGIQINSLTFEQTEIGLYATFNFTTTEAKFQHIVFKVVDASGNELAYMPVIGTGTIDNGDGTFSRTNNYQKPANLEDLQFMIRDLNTDTSYGPYSFGE